MSTSPTPAWRQHLVQLAAAPTEKIDEIRLAGFKVTNPEVMKTFIETKVGDNYDPVASDKDTTRLVARGDFSSVSYQLTKEKERNVLTYTATEKELTL